MRRKRLIGLLRSNWLLAAGLLLSFIFVYSDVILGEYQLSFTNMMYQKPPWNSIGAVTDGPLLSDVADGVIPSMYTAISDGTFFGFWDPQTALGAPEDVSIWLYPLNYLFLLPLGAAMLLRTCCEFLLAFIGMYLLMKTFGCRKTAAIAAGTAYCFSSVIVMWLGWQHSDVAAFAPLAFFFFERFLNSKQIKYCFGLTATVFLMLVAGMPTYAGYFLYLLAAYVFFHTIWVYKNDKKSIAVVFGGTLASVILGAVCSLPYTISLLSSLGGNGYMQMREIRAEMTLPWRYLHSLFFPYLRLDGSTMHMNESTIYVGLTGVLLFFFSLVYFRRKKRMVFWCAALSAVFLLIFTPVLDFVFTRLPAVNSSYKYRLITLFNFIMVVLMGLNLNDLLVNRNDYLKHKVRTVSALLPGTALLAGVFIYTLQHQAGKEQGTYFQAYAGIAILLVCLIAALLIRKIPTRIIGAGICLVILFDMGSFAKDYFPLVEKGVPVIPEATDTIAYLQENTDDERFGATGGWTLFPNTNVLYGLNDVRGHDFVFTNPDMSAYYTRLAEHTADSFTRYLLSGEINEPLLQYLGVKYLVEETDSFADFEIPGAAYSSSYIGNDGLMTLETEAYTQRVELADTVCVLADSDAVLEEMSRNFEKNTAFFTEEEARTLSLESLGSLADTDTAEITARTDDSVTVAVQAQTPKLLMLNEYYDADWKVYVDGKEQRLYKSNYLFRAVEVPAGASTVEFRYEPKLLYATFYAAGAGLLAVILLIVFRKRLQEQVQKIR